jgi:hypothetical protein
MRPDKSNCIVASNGINSNDIGTGYLVHIMQLILFPLLLRLQCTQCNFLP